MKSEHQLGHHECLALITIMMSAKIFLSFPRHMALEGNGAGWIIVLFSGVLSLGAFYFLYALSKRFPSQTLIEIFQTILGKIGGPIFGILIFLYFLIISSLALRQFAESFIIAILPRTPISVIITVFLFLIVYANITGIETITRVAWFFGPYLLIAVGIIICLSFNRVNFSNLAPFLGPGPLKLLTNSIIHTSLFTEVILFGLLAPLVRQREQLFKIGFGSLAIAIVINTTISLIVLAVFNYISSNKLVFPVLQLSRLISFSAFLERFESIFVFLWFFTAAIAISGLFYGALISFSQSFKIQNRVPLIFPLSLLIYIISLVPDSMTATVLLDDFSLSHYYQIIVFGIPLIFWLITTIFRQRFKKYGK